MKRFITILTVVFVAFSAFAKPIVSSANIGEENFIFISDDENQVVLPTKGLSDFKIVKIAKDNLDEKMYEYIGFAFSDTLNECAKVYTSYSLINKVKGYAFLDYSLDDGRMLRVIVLLKQRWYQLLF